MCDRSSEPDRRELANAHRGELLAGMAEPVAPQRLSQVLSLRLDPEVAAALRDVANLRGVTVSDLLREAAERIVGFHEDDEPGAEVLAAFEAGIARGCGGTTGYTPPASQTWGCQHMAMSGPILTAPTGWCGCQMALVETR